MKNEKYRFDNAYEKVYEYEADQKAYVFIGSFLAFGIEARMRKSTKLKLVEDAILYDGYNDE